MSAAISSESIAVTRRFTAIVSTEIVAGQFQSVHRSKRPPSGCSGDLHTGRSEGAVRPDRYDAAYDNFAAAQRASYVGHSFFYEQDWLIDVKIERSPLPKSVQRWYRHRVGYEHRETAQHSVPDPTQVAGDQLGFNGDSTSKFNQRSIPTSVSLSFLIVTSTMNVPFMRSLEFRSPSASKSSRTRIVINCRCCRKNESQLRQLGGRLRLSVRYQPIADLTCAPPTGVVSLAVRRSSCSIRSKQNFPEIFDPLNDEYAAAAGRCLPGW